VARLGPVCDLGASGWKPDLATPSQSTFTLQIMTLGYFCFRTPFETLTLLNREVELYNPELLRKPAVCLVNKMDAADSNAKLDLLLSQMENRQCEELLAPLPKDGRPEQLLEFQDFIPMSAKFSPSSVEGVKVKLRELVDKFDEDSSRLDKKYNEVVEDIERSLGETKTLII
jgi:GTPase involved in cell partitioning and DNA repair